MILVYLENNAELLPKSALVVINAALEAKKIHGYSKAVGVLLGDAGVEKAALSAAEYGLDEVLYVKSSSLFPYLALNHAQVIKELSSQINPKLYLAAATTLGKDLSPRIAFSLDAGQASDITALLPGGHFRRLMFAGNIVADVEITTAIKVATVRTTAFDPAVKTSSGLLKEVTLNVQADPRQTFVSFETVKSERPELAEAEIIVSGGRALKSAENFQQYLFPLAETLNAAIGASRAAVDSGYAPNDWQVGQTGKVVAPKLYIAVGISGAIQHLAGMKDSKVIVAINKDPEAPIFEVADYGLVADLYQAIPELNAEIKKAKA